MIDRIRGILKGLGLLADRIDTLEGRADLYEQGLTSFASVQLMLALEEAFDIEFPEKMLNRKTFASLDAIVAAVDELASERV